MATIFLPTISLPKPTCPNRPARIKTAKPMDPKTATAKHASPTGLDRRQLLVGSAAVGLATAALGQEAEAKSQPLKIRKAVKFHMVRESLSVRDKFKLLKDLGFDGVEIRSRDKVNAKAAHAASQAVDLPIHGVINSSDPDIKSAVDLARYFGGTSVLVVAGRVTKENYYDKVYYETQKIIRSQIEHAQKHNIRILVENVWNGLLQSPLEMARYIDELENPAAGAYFDVGNVVRFAYPHHWIPVLGQRIVKLDIKEYSRTKQETVGLRKGFQVPIGEGDCDWPMVMRELKRIRFEGWATAEVPGGGRDELAHIAARMNRVLEIS